MGWAFIPGSAMACNQEQDGCMGCNDEELHVCLMEFVQKVCQSSIDPNNCNAPRVYDDAESYIINNTRSHMFQMDTMTRSSHRYQYH